MIQLKEVKKYFFEGVKKTTALQGINLSIEKGEIFGVIGSSGAGKSTLLRTINLLEKPDEGEVIINQKKLLSLNEKELRDFRKTTGIIFQHFNLLSSYNVFDNVAEILRIHHYPKDKITEKVNGLLKLVGLEDKAHAYPSKLSGGQKQRVGIARALAIDPEILLCDEATSALDPKTTESILNLLLDINKKFNLTIVLITHQMEVIKKVCDRVAVMERGEIVEHGDVMDVFSQPKHKKTKSFVKTILNDEIPFEFLNHSTSNTETFKIIKVTFRGQDATTPVIDNISKNYNVTTNLLYGTITDIKGFPLGILTLKISGDESSINKALQQIKQKAYSVEIIQAISQKEKVLIEG
jgi:D-methionine transport system ATP-binding protein